MATRVRWIVVVLPAIWLAAPERAGAAPSPACAPGRFDVQGSALMGGGTTDAIVVGDGTVSIDSGCGSVAARRRGRSTFTKVRARWSGCGTLSGPVTLTARIDASTCGTMTGTLKAPRAELRRTFTAIRSGSTCDEGFTSTFALIENRVLGSRGCTVSTCHGSFAQANLDLRPGAAWVNLIDVPATNAAALAAGKRRIVPGDAAASFLSQKLHGHLSAGEGDRMPLIGAMLPELEVDLIDRWIDEGAPQTGVVAGAPCLPLDPYQPTTAPSPPTGGFQIVLDGPTLQPGEEQEGCLWIPVPNVTDVLVGRFEFFLNPGTHHYAIFEFTNPGAPTTGQWIPNDFGCVSGGSFGRSIAGSPQAPYFVDAYPPGIARPLRVGTYVGLNAHYRNEWQVPIQIKVWTNVHPYPGTPVHVAQTLVDFDEMFDISVPVGVQKIQRGRFTNTGAQPMSFVGLTGHMHKRGLRFTARHSDGTTLYENFDWAHPQIRPFDPPFVLAPGAWLDYECLHDNGVTRPVRRDGAGNPTILRFGLTTDDEMCTLNGTYY